MRQAIKKIKISTFCAARMTVQVRFPKDIKEQISKLTAPFRSRKRSIYSFQVKLNEVKNNLEMLTPATAQRKLFRLIEFTDATATAEIKAVLIEAVSAALAVFLIAALAKNQGLLLHGSYLKYRGLAYIFLGKSGAGKSTIARNALGVEIVHDDRLAVRKIGNRWWAFGVPLCDNDNNTGKNIEAPLAGVYIINKSDHLVAKRLGTRSSLLKVAPNVLLPVQTGKAARRILQTLIDFICENKCYQLRFAKNDDVATIL